MSIVCLGFSQKLSTAFNPFSHTKLFQIIPFDYNHFLLRTNWTLKFNLGCASVTITHYLRQESPDIDSRAFNQNLCILSLQSMYINVPIVGGG